MGAPVKFRDGRGRRRLYPAAWFLALTLVAGAAGACIAGSDAPESSAARVERCTERMLRRAEKGSEDPAVIKRYVERAYCTPFAERGWVYEDGTLAIGAYLSVAFPHAGTCSTQQAGEPPRTVPCEELDRVGPRVLDCAALHHVRRDEVQAYLRRLPEDREVRCDDGTPLEELGA